MNKPFSFSFKAARLALPAALGLSLVLLPATTSPQSLWRDDLSRPMYADKRASTAGDIVTIVVQENTTTSKNNKTATTKQSGMDASITSFFYSPTASGALTKGGQLPALKYSSKNDFAGGGTIDNSEKIVAYVAARVIDVLPNRNLVIEGKRETAFSGEQQTILLRGVVRPDDIAANNTVFSYHIADASIHFVSRGTLTDSQRKGWWNKLWDKISPF
jgi:flagellar L-ring protein precursor FlgH